MARRDAAAERRALLAATLAVTVALLIMAVFYFHAGDDSALVGDVSYASLYLIVDLSNRSLGASAARRVVYAGSVVQAVVFLTNIDAHYAIVAGSAVLWAHLLNVWIFDRLRDRAWWQAPLLSSAAAALLDSAIYSAAELPFSADPWMPVLIADLKIVLPLALAMVAPYWLILRFLPQ